MNCNGYSIEYEAFCCQLLSPGKIINIRIKALAEKVSEKYNICIHSRG